jgi:O-antigen ligase
MKFPFYTHHLGDEVGGVWRFAHQDYLQTIVEWGWVGAALWAVVFAGGVWLCFRNARALPSGDGSRTLLFTAGLALCGIGLHALVDFPLQIASLQLYVVVFLGLGWGATRFCGEEPR